MPAWLVPRLANQSPLPITLPKARRFKTLRVQRIYDEDTNTMVYVSFATRLDKSDDSNKSRFKSSLCAINLND
jgi:catabolite regulation protein CreA